MGRTMYVNCLNDSGSLDTKEGSGLHKLRIRQVDCIEETIYTQ